MRLGFNPRARCARREGKNGGSGLVWIFLPRIERIFTNSALPRDCCSGVSMSARGQARDGATEGRPEGRDERLPARRAIQLGEDRASQIERIFTNSALPRDCCSGVSMSARGSSDSAVIDSRYKPAWQRECLSRSRRACSPLSRSGALFAEDSACWFCSCSFVLFVVQMFSAWTSEKEGPD